MNKVAKEIGGWALSLGMAFAIALLIGIFGIQPTKVLGHSMDPTLADNQRIYVSKLSHTLGREPDYGDIVIIDSRVQRERTLKDDILEHPFFTMLSGEIDDNLYVKRVIGKAGDTLEFKNNKVYRNGEPLEEPYVNGVMSYQSSETVTVPGGHVFVMGDNRNNSKDSRDIGPVPLDHVLGIKIN
ncbi:signal peptidase I [Paenibacillus lutrae]|uniref:Signal peptidase I n=1 Tax=Paenibacillus lutrae TaxID=2078573 RepID=A0A7X3FEY7_9BACL|nr:signal peptidase I [Paenibacillus lutrae]MVO98470.1 signal peptidase I [Paenibacillus lutrae]